jgi:membrane-bound serine protease (ClpP class)
MAEGSKAAILSASQPIAARPEWILSLIRWLLVVLAALAITGAGPARPALLLDLDGAIGPATVEYVEQGLEEAEARGAGLVVLQLDTPGGLDDSTRDIVRLIIASPVPVATYVAPSGARAASAGTYILTASHVAAMAPGTNVGAATPISIGAPSPAREGEEEEEAKPSVAEAKAMNDAAAWLRALAKLRGRNVEWADKAVRESESLAANEAAEQRVTDFVAPAMTSLLAQADGKLVNLAGSQRRLATRGLAVESFDPGWRIRLLSAIANPNVALILMMIGIYGLLFEFMNPGGIGPGVIGAIALLTGLYSLAVLPVNYAGVALILLGLGLMVTEAVTPTFGVAGVAGVISFVIGAVLLFPDRAPGFEPDWQVIGSLAAVSFGFVLLVVRAALSARRRQVVSGREEMIGSMACVLDWTGSQGHVFAHGERWNAKSPAPLAKGEKVQVRSIDGLTLGVAPAPEPADGDSR